jgi:hypothetical protein
MAGCPKPANGRSTVFRMECKEVASGLTVRIEGRFVGRFAEEAKQLIARRQIPTQLTVDLSDMTFVDLSGEEALTWLSRIGAQFVAQSSYPLAVCERLCLPRAENCLLARCHRARVKA